MERGKMDQKAQRVLNREIDNMELLHHPNIIRLFEARIKKNFILFFSRFIF